jgi:hypothetical protein
MSNGDIGQAVENAVNLQLGNASFLLAGVMERFSMAAQDMARPSVQYRPALAPDGNQWCALYGTNLMEGVSGFGDSPADAMADFDKNWNEKIGVTP